MSYIGTALRISPTRDIALGNGVLTANSGADNCAIGDGALEDNTSGISNCAFGTQSLASNLVGSDNTAMGSNCARLLSSGDKNTIIGSDTASAAPTLNACTIIGKGAAGFILTSLTEGTLIGAGANAVDGLTNVIAIGAEAVVSASNCAVIGGTGVNAVNLGLGTSLPTARLSVYGGIVVKQDVTVNGPGAYNVLVTDYIVKFNTTVATAQAFLPDPTTPTNEGQVFIFKDISGTAGTNNITIFPGGAATIDGAASYVINVSYGSITVFSDGTNYYIT